MFHLASTLYVSIRLLRRTLQESSEQRMALFTELVISDVSAAS